MVVFTCGHCGESVQKPKVEKHYLTKCRNRTPNLSCMDCFKDFLGNDYEAHTKCITEEQRYSGKGFVAKEKKGEKKQNAWVEMLQSVLDEQKGAPGNVRRIIETISKHNNTPRKKPKFINFVKNVCGQRTNPKDMEQAWDLISVKLSELSTANAQNRHQNQNNATNGEEKTEPDDEVEKENGEVETEKVDLEEQNNHGENEDAEDSNVKKSKKQRKEEKKRKKYEAALQSAAQPAEEEEEEIQPTKKEKKKKNKSESNGDVEEPKEEEDNKNKKRKRQDTVNGAVEVKETVAENIENEVPVGKVAQKKKKIKGNQEEEDSICLHDQNVAMIGDLDIRKDKFDWHAVIMSVLEKKGNEVPFKRLQKKVLGEYAEATGQEIDDRIADKFIKKLKSAPNVRVDKNRVLLLD